MKLPTSEEMRRLDHSASADFAVPSIVLMENAGLGTVLMMEQELGPPPGNSFAPIFIGPGNNGGDGLVIGRHLHQRGCLPLFFFLVDPATLVGDAAVNLQIIRQLQLPFHVIDTPARVENIPLFCRQHASRGHFCYAVVDAIFGIGLSREVVGHFADTIHMINQPGLITSAPVVAVDTPSGLDVDTGRIFGCCVRADYTATYAFAKPGQYINGSTTWAGKLKIIDIGIPPEAVQRGAIATHLATTEAVAAMSCRLRRKAVSHKGSHGHLLVLAGSTGKTGAAILTARGALHAGAGLVTLCVPENLNPVFEVALPEAMTAPLSHSVNCFNIADFELVLDNCRGKAAVVLGPGVGQDEHTAELVVALYGAVNQPMLLDADAVNILAGCRKKLPPPAGPRIFTPHPGELSRLLGWTIEEIASNRLEAARKAIALFVNDNHATALVLKGAGSITVDGYGTAFINTTGNPGMASGGMGDVLSGVIGALLCQGMAPLHAAVTGVFLHGRAADLLHKERGVGYLAGEVAAALPLARKHFQENQRANSTESASRFCQTNPAA
jgi:ADP-dependent NAD(P)H-hydrate dehydratase / NAD(P)H-hydrate epimerase